jgi:energy-converting hydrogenase Eha subunit G
MEYARLIIISSPVGDFFQSWLFHGFVVLASKAIRVGTVLVARYYKSHNRLKERWIWINFQVELSWFVFIEKKKQTGP